MSARLSRPASRALRQLSQAARSTDAAISATTPASRALFSTSTSQNAIQSAAAAAVAAQTGAFHLSPDYVPPTKPPSARPVETRKAQLIRNYTSLLRSSPLILFFQHTNLTAMEWAAVRRELRVALQQVAPDASGPNVVDDIHLSVLRPRMLRVALKLVSFFDAEAASKTASHRKPIAHDLSMAAYEAMKKAEVPADSTYAQVEPLLVGPVAGLVFPSVSPQHLAAALKILSPGPAGSAFAPPKRKKSPGYYEINCQSGLQKLLLVGGRIEESVFDVDGVRQVGAIEGGMDGLRSQLVSMLQGAGLGLTSALEAGSKSLWLSLESHRSVLDEQQNGGEKKADEGEEKKSE